MAIHRNSLNKRMLALTCGWALALGQSWALAVPAQPRDVRPKINLFPTSVVESLSQNRMINMKLVPA